MTEPTQTFRVSYVVGTEVMYDDIIADEMRASGTFGANVAEFLKTEDRDGIPIANVVKIVPFTSIISIEPRVTTPMAPMGTGGTGLPPMTPPTATAEFAEVTAGIAARLGPTAVAPNPGVVPPTPPDQLDWGN